MSRSPSPSDHTLRERLQKTLGDRYIVTREMTGGGSAHVFLATEVALERPVVLKVLPSELADGVDGARFHREILIAARLQHPHLVPLLSAGEPDAAELQGTGNGASLRWYSMPFVDGLTLRELLARRGPLPLPEAVRLLREMASALSYAHARGVVHRDIKPENVLLSDGVAMISDFGVAKALDDASAEAVSSGRRVTTVSMMLGTPAYMSPEQVNNARGVDHKADLYAFACVAYELLVGTPPLVRPSLRATMAAQLSEAPVPVQQLRPEVPDSLADLLMQCLEKDPRERPHSASVIVKVLDELATPNHGPDEPPAGLPTVTAGAGEPDTTPDGPRRVSLPLGAAVLLVVGLAIAAWWLGRGCCGG